MAKDLVIAIDRAVSDRAWTEATRGHLGASGIGAKCARQVWYGFRWAYREKHTGRLQRLFRRGHKEEFTMVEDLRLAGAEVREYRARLMYHSGSDCYTNIEWDTNGAEDPEWHTWMECDDVSDQQVHIERAATGRYGDRPRQWGFEDHDGHFAGSCDGKISWPGTLPDGWGLLECKTHNDKSFKLLTAKGVLSSKPVHYVQMQIYMHYLGLPWALYLAVNKNDDTYYTEILYYKPELAQAYVDAAARIIWAKDAPKRLTDDPSWFECKFCAFREICHYDDSPQKNCRSCAFAEPVADKGWRCTKFHSLIPKEFIPEGCDVWEGIR